MSTPTRRLRDDTTAANVVFGSGTTHWQVPASTCSVVPVGCAELRERIGGTRELADHLIDQLVEWIAAHHGEPTESRSLGGSAAIPLVLDPRGGVFRAVPAPSSSAEGGYLPGSGHPVRVFDTVDVRCLQEDVLAEIRLLGREGVPGRG